jgi:hypothetical protein
MTQLLKKRATRSLLRAGGVAALTVALVACAALSPAVAFAQGTAAKPAGKLAGKPAAKKADDAKPEEPKKTDDVKPEEPKKADDVKPEGPPGEGVEPPREEWNIKDVTEVPGKTYLFIGARYRGNVIPKFMLNMFVDEGATFYSNSIGIELDMRKDGFSLIPALSFTEYGTGGDVLFKEKGSKDIAGNYSFVNSGMKAIYATADLLWSVKISKNVDFEYGAGFGLGVVFGDLANNWVYKDDPNGPLVGSNGTHYSKCTAEGQGGSQSGCNKADHQNASTAKVGNYTEPGWLNGGSKPVIFPWISIPQIGLRFKPIKQFEGRLGLGFSLTGFWFGLNGAYGLEQKPKP